MHIIFQSSTYGDPDLEHAAWSIADLVEADRLHASTACKAHPVGYRDIPRGPSSITEWRRVLACFRQRGGASTHHRVGACARLLPPTWRSIDSSQRSGVCSPASGPCTRVCSTWACAAPAHVFALHSSPEQFALHSSPEQRALHSSPEQRALHSSPEQLALHSSPAVACASAPPVCEPKPNPAVACASASPVCEPEKGGQAF